MAEGAVSVEELRRFPPVDERQIDEKLKAAIAADDRRIVVLDDDPTGVQTVHDVSVYTDWTVESIRQGFAEENRLFYILTNSRSFTEAQTSVVHREIAENVWTVSQETGQRFLFISRSDSTLRGHYPLETQILRDVAAEKGHIVADGEILCPFFPEGGRYTLHNIHYVRYGDTLIPAGETEFAKDRTFGFKSSDLTEYVEEKTGGRYPADRVVTVSLDSLRRVDIDGIRGQLMAVQDFNKVIVNAVDYCDLKVFCTALYQAMAQGKNFLFRTAAGFVKVMGGISDRPLLTRREMIPRETENGGMVIVGSHTQKTTAQLEALLTLDSVVGIELNSDLVLEGSEVFFREVDRVVAESERVIRSGKTAVCYTCRRLLTVENDSPEEALLRSVKISEGVWSLAARLGAAPAFVVAKGGITSSDVGTKALKVRRACVMGQIQPGIPVWQTGEESRFPLMPYVIFPGNVGEAETLKQVVEILQRPE